MRRIRIHVMVAGGGILLNACVGVYGCRDLQKDLKIQEVFQRYGRKNVMSRWWSLSNEMLETYGMTRYKSITIKR